MRGSDLAHGCGRGSRVVLPLARAAAVSTGLRVRLDDDVLDLLGRLLDAGEEDACRRDAEAVVAVVRLARVEAVVVAIAVAMLSCGLGEAGSRDGSALCCGEGRRWRNRGFRDAERRCLVVLHRASVCRYPAAHARRAPGSLPTTAAPFERSQQLCGAVATGAASAQWCAV